MNFSLRSTESDQTNVMLSISTCRFCSFVHRTQRVPGEWPVLQEEESLSLRHHSEWIWNGGWSNPFPTALPV